MPDRFGGGGDYSATFAYLSDNYLANLERQAELANERRESEQAAKDTEAFARYDAGKMSGAELLDYIRKRITQTAYDPKQQAEWKKALLEYTESINDGKALAAFERTNDYNGYIEYLRGKMSTANPTDRAQLQGQINQLIDQRDSQNVTRGAERIMLQINKGKATYEDLLAFYRNALKNTRKGSEIRNSIRSQITNVAQQVRANNLTLRKGQLDDLLARGVNGGGISPQEYGRRLRDLARSSGLQVTDPGTYTSWMTTASQAINTVTDFGRLAEIDGMLQRGDITPQEAERLYYKEAERYKGVDPKTYQQILNEGYRIGNTPVEGQTPLPNPGILGLPDNKGQQNLGSIVGDNRNRVLRFITQLDGSEYGQVNCVYSSAAMLAYAMGYRDKNGILSGGDLRYLSGDRSIGTNLDEAEAALGKLGITGLRNWNDRHIDFDAFKNRVGKKGMPAVLMGINNNLPDELKAFAGASKGHGVFIAAYDPKKRAFLWYDPAISKRTNPNYNGVWVDESVVRNFGWGPSYSDGTGSWSFSGQALFAPPGTLKGDWTANNVKRPPIKYINVDDAPVRPETPKRYKGYNHRGPSTVEPVGNPAVDRKGRPRAGKANPDWIDPSIDTVEEVQQQLKENHKRLEILTRKSDAGELDDAAQRAVDQEILDLFDRDLMYAEAAGLDSAMSDLIDSRTSFLASVANRNSIDAASIVNTAIRDARRDWEIANADPDPMKAIGAMQVIKGRLQIINGVLQKGNLTETPLDDLSSDPKVPGNQPTLDAVINLLDMVTTPGQGPVGERLFDIQSAMESLGASADQFNKDGQQTNVGDDLGNMVTSMLDQRDAQDKIEAGTHIAVINGGSGRSAIVPLVPKLDWQTGQETLVPDFGEDEDGNPVRGIQVPVQTSTGVVMKWVVPSVTDSGLKSLAPAKNMSINGVTLYKDVPLTEAQMSLLGERPMSQMINAGQLVERPYLITSVKMPDKKVNGRLIEGKTFFQDDSGGWYTGTPMVTDYGIVGGKYIGMDENLKPEFTYRPFATASMSPLPFQGDRAEIQKAFDSGQFTLPEGMLSRGPDGRLTDLPDYAPSFHTAYDPLSSAYVRAPKNAQLPGNTDDDRADRIENALKSIFEARNDAFLRAQPTGFDAIGSYEDGQAAADARMPLTVDTRTGPMTGLPGPQQPDGPTPGPAPDKWGSLGMSDEMFQSIAETGKAAASGFGANQAPRTGWSLADFSPANILEGGRMLGLNLPKSEDNQASRSKNNTYRPPAAKKVNGPQRRSESGLPKIGSTVMVGGTQIDLPSGSKPKPSQKFTPPPPNRTSGGGAAQASIDMLGGGKKKQTSKGAGGRYAS